MKLHYVKIYRRILDSTIAPDWQVRHVFQDFLIMADENGIVDMTAAAFAHHTYTPLKIVQRAIIVLEQPDPASRTPDEEGRRIIRLDPHRDWGWRITNFRRYLESYTLDALRLANAERQRSYRDRQRGKKVPQTPPNKTDRDGEGEGEGEASRVVTDSNGHVTDSDAQAPLLDALDKPRPFITPGLFKTELTDSQRISAERCLVSVRKRMKELGPEDFLKTSPVKLKELQDLKQEEDRLKKKLGWLA